MYPCVCYVCVLCVCVCVCVCEGDERFRNAMARLKGDFVCKKPSMKYVCARRRRHTIGGITRFVAAVTANDRCVFAFNPSIWRVLCIHSRLDCSDLTIRGNDYTRSGFDLLTRRWQRICIVGKTRVIHCLQKCCVSYIDKIQVHLYFSWSKKFGTLLVLLRTRRL